MKNDLVDVFVLNQTTDNRLVSIKPFFFCFFKSLKERPRVSVSRGERRYIVTNEKALKFCNQVKVQFLCQNQLVRSV